ncbi:restriction endonuclease subunit S [Acinetobacter junii]|uniref:restriction endonuclease subunit S n=1 Tax=Acinetobacter TaxID=469 RepID=UPI000F6886F6|nr:restriction endonuclease subunit S [Acinetobacter junii]RSE32715.1 restriction endonuclease subunit S [Acinetobacter junii]
MAKYQAYAEYKDSGVEWLGEIPCHWDLKPIKYLFEIINGSTPKSGEEAFWDGEITWITPSDLSKLRSQVIGESIRTITKKGLNSCGTSLVPSDTIILSCRAPIGSLAVTSKEACTNQGCKSLVKKYDLSTKFFYYYLSISTKQLNNLGRGTTFLELSSDELGSYALGIPNAEEQTQIANFLDHETTKIDHLIEKQQQLIELLKEKRQAVISHAVTKGLNPNVPMKDSGVEWLGEVPEHWDIVKLSQIAVAFNGDRGANYPSGNDFVDEGIYFISANEVINAKVVTETASRITQKKYDELGGLKIKKGDIIYCLRGAGVGKNGICDFDEGTVSSSLMGIRSIKSDPDYLVLLLNSSAELQQRSVLVNGSVSPNLSAENVMGYKFSIPAVDEQIEIKKSIELRVNKIEILLSNAEQAIQLMRERRNALISAAVTGKIDVRHWQSPTVAEADTELSA